ncbi:MAG TPA: hypothetical protein VG497_30310 [Kribbella sp.]|nr:hypothetical protein [Kribbella sp.]
MSGPASSTRGPVIRLQGGPRDRWEYYEQDFLDCVRAAQAMGQTHGRPIDHPASWPLSYERPASGLVWVWRPGKNCHPHPIT